MEVTSPRSQDAEGTSPGVAGGNIHPSEVPAQLTTCFHRPQDTANSPGWHGGEGGWHEGLSSPASSLLCPRAHLSRPRLGPCSAFRRELHPRLPHQNFGTWPRGPFPSDQPRRPGPGIFAPPGALGGVTSHPSSGGSPSHCLASVPPESPHAPLPPGPPPARGHGRGGLRGPPATLTSGRPHLPLSAYGDSPAA